MIRPGPLGVQALRPRTGRGVRVVVIDSGVHASHPHVGGVAGGVGVGPDGTLTDEYTDALGHGTAVTAVIREKAPAAELLVARVFEHRLDTTVTALQVAIRWAAGRGANLINLSLGTAVAEHADALQRAVTEARAAGAWVVAAGPQYGIRWLPGALDDVVGVELDWQIPRDTGELDMDTGGRVRVRASGYPRPVPGVPPERNLKGLSFAVANATGLLALLMEDELTRGGRR